MITALLNTIQSTETRRNEMNRTTYLILGIILLIPTSMFVKSVGMDFYTGEFFSMIVDAIIAVVFGYMSLGCFQKAHN